MAHQNLEIVQNSDVSALRLQAQAHLVKLLNQATVQGPVLLLCSGGSALDVLMGDFSDLKQDEALKNLTVSVVDERFDPDPQVSNFSHLITTTFFHETLRDDVTIIDTRAREGQRHDQHAAKFENDLRTWKREHESGKVIAIFGIGSDGHTAGIMPFPDDSDTFSSLFMRQNWVCGYDAGKLDLRGIGLRTTLTATFLTNHIDQGLVWATGKDKYVALKSFISGGDEWHRVPSRMLRAIPQLWLYTDFSE